MKNTDKLLKLTAEMSAIADLCEWAMGRDDLSGKPDQIKAKIVEGRIGKRLKEMALLEQPFIKDSSINVEELVKQVAGKIGENVKVRRFTRYNLWEGIEVQEQDFAEEVASMTSDWFCLIKSIYWIQILIL